jgi:predicted phage-related endonuclease
VKANLFEVSPEEAFQEERKSGIGGSDAGAIYNMGFGCSRKLAYEKTGYPVDFKKVYGPELERGHMVEEVARKMYEKRTGRPVTLKPMARHPEYDWMMVHVDGETTSPTKEGPGYAEFKVVNRFVFKKFKAEGIREEYILQLQHGMAVMGYKWGSFGILCLDPWQFEWFDADRDEELIKKLISDEAELWKDIKNEILPKPLANIKDKRCQTCPYRRTCRGDELSGVIPDNARQGEALIQRPELVPLLEEITDLKGITDEATTLYDEAKAKLKLEIGEAYGVVAPGYRALMPTSYPERWDTKALTGIVEDAKKIISSPPILDYEELEKVYKETLDILLSLTKAKKPAEATRSLRIYSTGD